MLAQLLPGSVRFVNQRFVETTPGALVGALRVAAHLSTADHVTRLPNVDPGKALGLHGFIQVLEHGSNTIESRKTSSAATGAGELRQPRSQDVGHAG